MAFNGFFGHISGPFNANQNIFEKINREQCDGKINYISKIGIHYPINFDYPLTFDSFENFSENSFYFPIKVSLYDAEKDKNKIFQLGKTGMLELQDVKITTSIFFLNDVDDNVYIDYQYK